MIVIRPAESAGDMDRVRELVGSFVAWLTDLYPHDPEGVDANFTALESELAGLPGRYAPPSGRLLLAVCHGTVAGMVALQDLGGGACEMKRMFVDPGFHGRGVGRALAEALIAEARNAGYVRMLLDTGYLQVAARGLYRSLGFREIEPYYDVAADLRAGLTFMELPLGPRGRPAG